MSFSVSNGKGISIWIVSADADSADITSGGSSVSMSTVCGTCASSSAENDTLCFLAAKPVSHKALFCLCSERTLA